MSEKLKSNPLATKAGDVKPDADALANLAGNFERLWKAEKDKLKIAVDALGIISGAPHNPNQCIKTLGGAGPDTKCSCHVHVADEALRKIGEVK